MAREKLPKRRKRLVTKGEYARHLGRQFSLTGVSVFCLSIGLFCLVVAVLSSVLWYIGDFGARQAGLTFCILSLVVGCVLLLVGSFAKRQVETAEPIAPLTRFNSDKLRPEESLVRAASEPAQPQEDVLLRPASGATATEPEQLLRASASEVLPDEG